MSKKSAKSKSKKIEKKKLQLVYIEWCDACTGQPSWINYKGALKWGRNQQIYVRQCGFVLEQNEEFILFATEWSKSDESFYMEDVFASLNVIPTTWIRELKVIKEFDCEALNEN